MRRASSGVNRPTLRVRASRTTKSLPSPFILRKGMVAAPFMSPIYGGRPAKDNLGRIELNAETTRSRRGPGSHRHTPSHGRARRGGDHRRPATRKGEQDQGRNVRQRARASLGPAVPARRAPARHRAPGRMRIVTKDGRLSAPIAGVPEVAAVGQGGLLDVLLAPDFAKTGMIYFSYGEPRGEGKNGTSVARAKLVLDGRRRPSRGRDGRLPAAAGRRQRASFRLAARVGARRDALHHDGRAQRAAAAGAEPRQRHRQGNPHQPRRHHSRRQSEASRLGTGGLVDRASQHARRGTPPRNRAALYGRARSEGRR